ncbi:bifunctional proline dehydrogenase/L-glutamate gamma-semialdehyde dehydrogenase PutA [Testudinibacter aquarius]|uniref:Bifunctional protein PutA n=1 Tax=Testudinibacter aquarius TaxID=1524974 RepID=A0A4R3YCN4_9PAST|nr:bifunctional proline dehydrogenase/L-glutamate gamma-semialdehyde dehydrogenase PutA [Testudinibacter aquarius]KAE9528314.1 bifunctional proline dehydrogenase/L-glutamate gamma-semialdehyde dehydrogenase [Testudinibacter aquarius]TCV88848.1 L-proline dehydrogenase /delta-1-pyrroline-5-carboxylate dehydrogenase [Testudinibacter aquarius]TNG93416.1 bifunctional proline dehydrogenase/L-glutamate gamma-semialdehyde dehydrogenase PutA [Testudinibacter aquarius]
MQFHLAKHYPPSRQNISKHYRIHEKDAVDALQKTLIFTTEQQARITQNGIDLINRVRSIKKKEYGVDALMKEFSLGDEEGIALMCLAEALLRIPDNQTRDELIHDKLKEGDWRAHIGKSSSFFINAASYGLLLGKNLSRSFDPETLSSALTRSFARLSAPMMRLAMVQAMKVLGEQFVTGINIQEALNRTKKRTEKGYCFSFDMLGEAALTQADAERYFQDYLTAIETVGKAAHSDIYRANSVSVKLSAIHPRYSRAQYDRVMTELYPKLKRLYLLAKQYNISVNIDAEEASRLELSLDLVEKLLDEPELKGYRGIGFVVQAYSKRCPYVIDYLIALAREKSAYLMIRLVKGAYWDSEIKWAQADGLDGFPLYTRKNHTDIAYLACAQKLLAAQDVVYPQFATHNVQTLCTIYELGHDKRYEFQCLHGMGETLYDQLIDRQDFNRPVRIYAPVGTHETLLAYLVRRLLENGANSSFVHQLVDESIPAAQLMTPPWQHYAASQGEENRAVRAPSALFADRLNSSGFDLANELELDKLEQALNQAQIANARSLLAVNNEASHLTPHPVRNPADLNQVVAEVAFFAPEHLESVFNAARQSEWQAQSAVQRAQILRKTADLYQQHHGLLMKLAVLEAGKTLPNAIAELREAVDFLRYYAAQLDDLQQRGKLAPPRGTALCISPWNFPLAIFTGQIAAALAAGNAVIAKPAEQTSLIAYAAVNLFYQAGLPRSALQLILGAGDVGAALVKLPFDAIVFTGSTDVAKLIAEQCAQAENEPVLIAETGGQNVLVVDSSALSEQVVADVLSSAFDSAGQRCSALRVLLLQQEVADKLYTMLAQALQELTLGNPALLATDIGPVIDEEAKQNLLAHKAKMRGLARRYIELESADNPEAQAHGHYVAPAIYLLDDLQPLQREVFGPILHIVPYHKAQLAQQLQAINAKGYALTGGCHSRIRKQIDFVERHLKCGNFYVNRNIVGAVVGVQPFGGHGLSGTGPKAGGEFYLQRLTRATDYYSRFGDEKTLLHAKPQLDSITGEENTLAYFSGEVAILNGDLQAAQQAAERLRALGFSIVVEPSHPLAQSPQSDVRIATQWKNCQKGVFLAPLSAAQRLALQQSRDAIFKCYDWQQTQDIMPLYDEFSRSENTTAAGGNASLMATQEQ